MAQRGGARLEDVLDNIGQLKSWQWIDSVCAHVPGLPGKYMFYFSDLGE